jgi:hypothetical protein
MKSVPMWLSIAALIAWAALSSGNVAFAKDKKDAEVTTNTYSSCDVECAADFLGCKADQVRGCLKACKGEPTLADKRACLAECLDPGSPGSIACRDTLDACLAQCQ